MRFLITLCLLVNTFCVFSQKKYSINSKRAIKYYLEAGKYYHNYQDDNALLCLSKSLKIEANFIEALLFKADIYNGKKQYQLEALCYEKIEIIDAVFFPKFYYNWALCLLKEGKYINARNKLFLLLKNNKIDLILENKSRDKIAECDFAIKSISQRVDYNPINLGDKINTPGDEYWPNISVNNDYLVFTNLSVKGTEARNEDFYMSKFENDQWQQATPLAGDINTPSNEGAQTVRADGNMMYFTACGRSDSYGSCDIYFSEKKNGKWSKAKNMGSEINSSAWEAQPSISADGRDLFFVSNRKSGKGKMDIWHSKLLGFNSDGSQRWSRPLCMDFNTSGDEMSPFIHANNTQLYFSSNKLMGMGGMDIFSSSREIEGKWSEPKNLPYPINTYADEIGLVVSSDGNKAFFSSNIILENGKDLFCFDMPEQLKIKTVSCPEFFILDSVTKKPLLASVSCVNMFTNDTIFSTNSTLPTGKVTICNSPNDTQLYTINSKDYMMFSKKCNIESLSMKKEILLSPIKLGARLSLRNVFFDTDSYVLKKESYIELNNLLKFVRDNNIKIEIGGHTDNVGSNTHNINLSENRAKAVWNYLLDKGLQETSVSYKAYASTKPVASNDSPKGRALNRRTEIIILSNK